LRDVEEGRLVEEVEKEGGANALERKGERSPTRIQVNAFMLQSIQRINISDREYRMIFKKIKFTW
jgi:hypothetical protein